MNELRKSQAEKEVSVMKPLHLEAKEKNEEYNLQFYYLYLIFKRLLPKNSTFYSRYEHWLKEHGFPIHPKKPSENDAYDFGNDEVADHNNRVIKRYLGKGSEDLALEKYPYKPNITVLYFFSFDEKYFNIIIILKERPIDAIDPDWKEKMNVNEFIRRMEYVYLFF
jgi:hypothetical protein